MISRSIIIVIRTNLKIRLTRIIHYYTRTIAMNFVQHTRRINSLSVLDFRVAAQIIIFITRRYFIVIYVVSATTENEFTTHDIYLI